MEIPVREPRRGGRRVIGARWGVTDQEVARHYPCDDLAPSPALELWRGVTVDAAPAEVWPWLRQLQLAPYSYDWVDNLGHRSPRELRDLPDPVPGARFSHVAGRLPVGRVLSVVSGEQLTAKIMGALMSYVLVPQGDATRLLLKVVMARDPWYATALALGDWPMARRQLLTLKQLAETRRTSRDGRDALQGRAVETPVRKVAADALTPGQPTPGMQRSEAVVLPDLWSGTVRTEAGATSGWHHHGEHDTVAYVVRGAFRVETAGGVVLGEPGDFLHIPAHTVHRESNPTDEPADVVLVRRGSGPVVVNVDGPSA